MKRLLCILFCLAVLQIPANAAVDLSPLENVLPSEASDYAKITPESGDLQTALSSILAAGVNIMRDNLRATLAEGFVIFAIAAGCGVLKGFSAAAHSDLLSKALDVAAICAVTAFCIGSTSSVLETCGRAIRQLGSFSSVFIPVYGAAVAVSGWPTAALSSASATLAASNILLLLAAKVLIPITYLHILLTAAGQIAEQDILSELADLLRKGALGFYKYFLMLYAGYLSLSGLISGGSDAMALRTAKMTISGSVPVLGSVVSDVSETLLSGAVILRNAVGIYGFVGAVAICLTPFLSAWVRLLVFRVLSMLAAGLTDGRLPRLLNGISDGYSMAIGLLGTCCVLLFLSFVIGSVVIGS